MSDGAGIVAQALRDREQREKGYRDKALKMYPHVCGRCGREFTGKRLRELTVHHRNHDHDHNPPDGSNWELLCIYCHDNEHQRYTEAEMYGDTTPADEPDAGGSINSPFANLGDLLKNKK